jgi:alanine racemase
MYSLSQISGYMGATFIGQGDTAQNWQLLTDSRTITNPETSIFFAIRTTFNDGHLYIPELIEKGVKVFVVEKGYNIPSNNSLYFLLVDDVVTALQQLAATHRAAFDLPVICITGSNGKTIVKEWLLQLMGNELNICSSPKSYNSKIGVPLSVWQLQPAHQMGIFEAGISTVNDMQVLEKIIQPDIGILTHLGTAHNEGFSNFDEKINEKLKLFTHCKTVLMVHNPSIRESINCEVQTYGFDEEQADLNITVKAIRGSDTHLGGTYRGKETSITIPFTDEASIENACVCWLSTLYLGRFDTVSFGKLSPVSMRLELKKGIHNCLLVNDSYSNDLHALSVALSFLKQQSIHSKNTVIISDIDESGLTGEGLCRQVHLMLAEKKIARLIAIGPVFSQYQDLFSSTFDKLFFTNTNEFLDHFYELGFHDETILIKGARKFQFEKIVKKLEQLSHGTILEINLTAALHNLEAIKRRLDPDMKIMAMVKAFAYGSGSYEMAKLIQHKVDYLAVAYSDEGVALRQNGIQKPIMVMNADEDAFDQLLRYNLEPVIFSTSQLKAILQQAELQTIRVHIEIDTGMHRLGFKEEDIPALIQMISNNPRIYVASVFSHLSASDEERHDDFTKQQFDLFNQLAADISQQLGYSPLKHISNTAATLRFGQEAFNMVRLGIGLYGIDPTGKFDGLLEPVFTLRTTISQIKHIEAHESVGYSRQSISERPRRIAVLALGYADGLNRALSNGRGRFEINGQYAPILGNVCMDMCMIDVTDIKCNEGDEAILFGKNTSIHQVAETLETIPYEILTSISQRVKRVYVSE